MSVLATAISAKHGRDGKVRLPAIPVGLESDWENAVHLLCSAHTGKALRRLHIRLTSSVCRSGQVISRRPCQDDRSTRSANLETPVPTLCPPFLTSCS